MISFSQQLLRAIILLSFSGLIFMLHHTGEMSKYINMKYSGLSKIASLIFLFLFFIQIKNLWLGEKREDHECHDGCTHDHGDPTKWNVRTGVSYAIILLPLLTGFLFPAKTLDAAMAAKKGVLITPIKPTPIKDQPSVHEELPASPIEEVHHASNQNNLSYLDEIYEETVNEVMEMNEIKLEGKKFAAYADSIFLYPEKFKGKSIEMTGFVYKEEQMKEDELVVARFLITHCVADASVVGLLAQMEDAPILTQDSWIKVRGVIDTATYGEFEMPVIKVNKWQTVERPSDPYIYP
ncbi:TIGR03943 family protein [Ammoniphilus sp. CFH 90114]|uniref:TIGR03943 family putative permease subunit n=1 Tax=Ammoniphilus sp. CFH 90114 TaxID=2493665 RepID=UPI00100EDF2E|nr:TIGR03943 family protein [Ammoniphilus sp. CFH 90114]RXT13754.1 TIGR03943 family protein [Ammoniphilus sp. CFH 90114]